MFHKKKKYDIYVHNKLTDYALSIFFGIVFFPMLISNIKMYVFDGKSIGFHFGVSLVLLLCFGFLMAGSYAIMAGKAYIKGDVIKIKKWYGRTKTCDVKNIDKIILGREDKKIDSVTICIGELKILFLDYMVGFDEMLNYLCNNVDESKFE